ncbi:hypothetical protein BDZ97DRAFT_1302503 [Flammula alnicola]|nr:hypothetical protein BDZ97DRAFT_1302503 [Flammula alnicola]
MVSTTHAHMFGWSASATTWHLEENHRSPNPEQERKEGCRIAVVDEDVLLLRIPATASDLQESPSSSPEPRDLCYPDIFKWSELVDWLCGGKRRSFKVAPYEDQRPQIHVPPLINHTARAPSPELPERLETSSVFYVMNFNLQHLHPKKPYSYLGLPLLNSWSRFPRVLRSMP